MGIFIVLTRLSLDFITMRTLFAIQFNGEGNEKEERKKDEQKDAS